VIALKKLDTGMSETPSTLSLENFRDPSLPFVYWIEDASLAEQVMAQVVSNGKFGLETGFGRQPTKLFLIDPTMTWLGTEIEKRAFDDARENLQEYWEGDEFVSHMPPTFRIILLNTASDSMGGAEVANANTLVYRNLDHRDTFIPEFNKLQKGQRLVFIVDSEHIYELNSYRNYLTGWGYDASQLKERSSDLPSFSMMHPGNLHTYVLDITG
jgi:hypothetical protein